MEVDEAGGSAILPHSFQQFAQALSACKTLPASSLLDPSEGLALLFADACQNRSLADGDPLDDLLEESGNDDNDVLDWKLEEQTWRLIHLLHAERMQRSQSQKHDAAAASTSKKAINPYQTPFSAVQDILENDESLSELKIIRDWLSSNLKCTHPVEVRKGYWPFTKNRLRSEKRVGSTSSRGGRMQGDAGAARRSTMIGSTGRGVKTLDPDAVSREMSTLELEDATYEKALNKTLFEYVRAGQLDSAVDLARQADRSWRAASLRGAALYWRPGLNDEMEEINSSMGNRNRTLWKAVCRSLCAKATLDEYEKGLYGALSGDLKSVLAVSTSWESHLWAYTNARLEASIDAKLDNTGLWWGQDAGGQFGQSSNLKDLGSVRLNELSIPNVQHDLTSQGEVGAELKDVFGSLAQTNQHNIHVQADHPFRIVQRAVILSDVPRLLDYIVSKLPAMKADSSPRQYARVVRFFAHLTLYLRLLDWSPMPDSVVCNSILKSYVEILEQLGEDELVALYASSLEAESATESYAHYLKMMDVNERMETKRIALLRAESHDLDVAAVAISTVTMIFDEVFPSMMPNLTSSNTPLSELSLSITFLEERLIRAIDWLCIHDSTHREAIVHINILMRLFLTNGRLNAARVLLFDLSAELIQKAIASEVQDDGEAQAMEFVHWRTFFDILGNHMRFVEVWSKRPSDNSSKIEKHNWVKGLGGVVELTETSMMEILQMDWLKLEFADTENIHMERRRMELSKIRQMYIPELVLRLHFMLYEVRDVLPQYLTNAILLPDLIADESHKLYLDFVTHDQNRLQEYLGFVRLAHLAALEQQADPFALANM
ncbi:hypothetical protein CBS101457_000704 [Exobasidium rhododendri]|nr:hypothetical protein CBS101457_000704 [Exobasidium rhododendri]